MENGQLLEQDLNQFTGTDQWYRHGLVPKMLYTDGVRYFAENAGGGAYWFLDIVATELFQLQSKVGFVVITADVAESKAQLYADDGNDNVIWQREIEYTDMPTGKWKFYLTDNVLLLPSEY